MYASYSGVSFATFEATRGFLEKHLDRESSMMWMVSGTLGANTATCATYPLDLVRTRLVAQQQHKVVHGIVPVVKGIIRNEGIRGLYSGLAPTLLGVAPHVAIQFWTYGKLRNLFYSRVCVYVFVCLCVCVRHNPMAVFHLIALFPDCVDDAPIV
jgi:solute carrier family 25 (mitochondrial phosphate transporter), member 23/24/25/41